MLPFGTDRLSQLPCGARHHVVARSAELLVVGCGMRRRGHERAVAVHVAEVLADPSPQSVRPSRHDRITAVPNHREHIAVRILAEHAKYLAPVLEVRVKTRA